MHFDSINSRYSIDIEDYLNDLTLNQNSLANAISKSQNHLNFLKSQIKIIGFKSPEQEIHFFKHIKSIPLSHLLYFLKVQKLLQNSPLLLKQAKRKYIIRKMASLNRFHRKHTPFIEYIKQERTHLDSLYFTRATVHLSPNKHGFISDPEFSTSHDYLLAKYHASLLFGRYLTHQLDILEHGATRFKAIGDHLRWTSQKVDLIELIYALHSSGVFDYGNASVKKIANHFQEQFQCDLGDYYRTYSELRYRKKSRTKFLDQLSEKLQQKMDSDDL